MEKEEQKWEQEEVEEEQEEEDTSLQVRKSRPVNETKSTEISIVETKGNNGTTESNGHEIQSTVTANGTKDFEPTLENKETQDELDGIVGNEEEISDGLHKSDNLVFFDKDKGIWKCRICSWIYENGSACVDHMQHHKGQLHKLMNHKTLNNETGGDEFTPTSGEQQIEKSNGRNKVDILSKDFVVPHNSTSTINGGSEGHLDDDSLFYSNHQHNDGLSNSGLQSSGEIESEEVYIVPGNEREVTEITEIDVERVLQNQTTHDLYCPNCNSCITRRVILRKRKRGIRLSEQDFKRNKLDAVPDSKLDAGTFQASSTAVHQTDFVGIDSAALLATDDTDNEREPYLFRCLSCFSFFIPTGNGLKLFRIFEGKKVKVNVQEKQVPSTKKNWFASMLAFSKQETAVAQGTRSREDVGKSDMGLVSSSNVIDHNDQSSFIQDAHQPSQASDRPVRAAGKTNILDGDNKISPIPTQGHTVNTKVLVGASGDETAEKLVYIVGSSEEWLSMFLGEVNLEWLFHRINPSFAHLLVFFEATIEHFEAYSSDRMQESKSSQQAQMNHETDQSTKTPPKRTHVTNGEASEDAISKQGGLHLLISSNEEFPTVEKPKEDPIPNQKIQISTAADGEVIQIMATPVSMLGDVNGKMDISLAVPHEDQHIEATIVTESVVENKKANFLSSNDGRVYPTEVSQHIITKTKFEVHTAESLKIDEIPSVQGASIVQGKDTVITIDARPVGSSRTGEDIVYPEGTNSALHSASQVSVADTEGTEIRVEFEIEVIKSIVYGGLAESITSLSVVSSAAGGDAATLNILALGIASLIGGLFVICHNLWELRINCVEHSFKQVSPVTEQRDRYKELLGRKENFVLHALVSILSYIIFGLVAPVTYGFSFRKSDNKEFKLIVAAAASLLCIVALAIGRAYVRRPPKPYLKSAVTFVILGFMVSGVSYVAGVLVERILEKLGLFHSSSGANLLRPQMKTGPSYSGWTSY